jgi:pimeloyl-ACP methyl ester carboxylesterase
MFTTWYFLILFGVPFAGSILYGFIVAYKLYHPYRKSKFEVAADGKGVQKLRIPSSQGIELDGLLLLADGSDHLVLITHEIGSYKESKIKLARWLVSEGFSVLLFDLRNHGASSKDRTLWPMSEKFTDDVEATINLVRNNLPTIKTLTLYSFSFSTFAALYIINRKMEHPNNIILDSGPRLFIKNLFGDFLDNFGREMGLVPSLLKRPIFYNLLKKSFQYFGLRMFGSSSWPPDLSKIQSRVLFISNAKDPIYSEEELRTVADKVVNKQVWICPKSSHLQAFKVEPKQFQQVILAFLQQQPLTID